MTPESDRAAGDLGRAVARRLLGIDQREVDRAPSELDVQVLLDAAAGRRARHRNATARNAKSAIVIAALLVVCARWSSWGSDRTESTNPASAAATTAM